ncbi:MAG: hypothetical protein JSV88_14670, partial [Candidatus Aminicenantes bacterium]
NDPRSATFILTEGVKLYGGFSGSETPGTFNLNYRDFKSNETILSGDIGKANHISDNSYHVVSCSRQEDETFLDGFTITGGDANGTNYEHKNGGGIIIDSAWLTVTNCTFAANRAAYGGGGIAIDGNLPRVKLMDCKFYGNSAGQSGGGVYNCADNSENVTMVNCLFSGNSANSGAGFFNWEGDWTLINCTFSMNVGKDDYCGAGIYNVSGNLTICNSILWGNINLNVPGECAQLFSGGPGTFSIHYSCVQGWTGVLGGEGNQGSRGNTPLFVDADGLDDIPGTLDDNLRLLPGSCCIDAGNNECVLKNMTGDFDGNPRFIDDPGTPDSGKGIAPIIDMGVYEYPDPLRLYHAVSRKVHSTAGEFDIDLPLHPGANKVGVEIRSGGPTQVILYFTKTIASGKASLSCGTLKNITVEKNRLFLEMTDVPDSHLLGITLTGIKDTQGKPLIGVKNLYVSVFQGDVNGDDVVNTSDLDIVHANLFQPITKDNFKCDVKVDGIINGLDLGLINAQARRISLSNRSGKQSLSLIID